MRNGTFKESSFWIGDQLHLTISYEQNITSMEMIILRDGPKFHTILNNSRIRWFSSFERLYHCKVLKVITPDSIIQEFAGSYHLRVYFTAMSLKVITPDSII